MLRGLIVVAVLGAAGAWFLTRAQPLPDDTFAGLTADPDAGELVFHAAGCASCHIGEDADHSASDPVLLGGHALMSPFGTFYAPNITPDPDAGIGAWSDLEIASSIMAGVTPNGAHLYPAFPYTSYNKADPQDILNLVGYLRTLPADATPSRPHDIAFPFNIRLSIGAWKLLFVSDSWHIQGDLDAQHERGRYLVEALGHCSECHTPRNGLGGLKTDQWMRGAANPSGEGTIPSIHPGDLGWSETDIANYLKSGFTPDFDTVGGSMVDVVDNTSKLSDGDREAIAAYLMALP